MKGEPLDVSNFTGIVGRIVARLFPRDHQNAKDEAEAIGYLALCTAKGAYDPSKGEFAPFAGRVVYNALNTFRKQLNYERAGMCLGNRNLCFLHKIVKKFGCVPTYAEAKTILPTKYYTPFVHDALKGYYEATIVRGVLHITPTIAEELHTDRRVGGPRTETRLPCSRAEGSGILETAGVR